jgi:hypothetical protein
VLILGLAACDTAPTGDGARFVLTTRGDYVRSNAPWDIEVTLGSKLIRPADELDRFHTTLLHEPGLPFTRAKGWASSEIRLVRLSAEPDAVTTRRASP